MRKAFRKIFKIYLRELFTFFLIPFISRYFKSYTTVACLINGIIITIAVPPLLFLLSFL